MPSFVKKDWITIVVVFVLIVCPICNTQKWTDKDYKTLEPIESRNGKLNGETDTSKRQLLIALADQGMMVVDRKTGQLIEIIPGLLDETLLSRGSFAFGAKLVRFDKLKVLGNVYVNKINGKPLKESYLLAGHDIKPAGLYGFKRQLQDQNPQAVGTQHIAIPEGGEETMTLTLMNI